MITYGCEMWTMKKSDIRRTAAVEMKFMSGMAGVTLKDKVKFETITLELGVSRS